MNATGKKIKVLHVIESLSGGGVEETLLNICSLCNREKFQFVVYFCGYVYDKSLFNYRKELEKAGVEVIYKGIDLSTYDNGLSLAKNITNTNYMLKQARRFFIYIFISIVAFFQLLGLVWTKKPNVIHVHLYRLFVPTGIVGRLFGIPIVHTVPGLKAQLDSYQPFIYFIYRHFNYLADVFVTGASVKELVSHARIPAHKIRAIKSFVNLGKVKDVRRVENPVIREFNLYCSFPVILSVGRMDLEKGYEYSIRVAKKLLSRFAKTKLILLGDGLYSISIKRLIDELGLQDHCLLPGFRSDLENFHSISDIYLRSSIYEGANMASLLAMAYGKPVIGFDNKAETEVLIDGVNGVLIPTGDVERLASAIVILAENKELRDRIGKNARVYINKTCALDRVINIYEGIYIEQVSK